jgi:NADPH-dependent 2,4-dienoyl-CoA reductase/sulfur reductase-like enzyme
LSVGDAHQEAPSCDVAIVGAGPAGLAAADILRGHGLRVVVIDEQPRAGGQILRQPPRAFAVENWLSSPLYERVKALLASMENSDAVTWRFETTVLGILLASPYRRPAEGGARHDLWLEHKGRSELLRSQVVLLAPGCYERPLAFPGWTLPGVMGAGAIQGFVKSQQLVPGNRFLLAGHHPLQLVVADQLLAAGAQVAAVLFTQPMRRARAVLERPDLLLKYRRPFAETGKILRRLKRAGVPVLFGTTLVQAAGERSVEKATIAPLTREGRIDRDRSSDIDCDRIGVCHGFLASSELARQAGARVRLRENEGGWLALHDRWFESSVPKLFVAGEITGLSGAEAAQEKGRIAGCGILRALQRVTSEDAERRARPARRRLKGLDAFAAMLNRLAAPPQGLLEQTATADTILCRCESITFGEMRRSLQQHPHVASADAAKLLTRAGMGLCQGRFCAHHVAALVAEARGLTTDAAGTFHSQVPVKPVLLRALQPGSKESGN